MEDGLWSFRRPCASSCAHGSAVPNARPPDGPVPREQAQRQAPSARPSAGLDTRARLLPEVKEVGMRLQRPGLSRRLEPAGGQGSQVYLVGKCSLLCHHSSRALPGNLEGHCHQLLADCVTSQGPLLLSDTMGRMVTVTA